MLLICIALAALAGYLGLRLYLVRLAAREIEGQIAEILRTDTNTVMGISTSDRQMCRLAAVLNDELREMRTRKLRYQRGDLELKSAVTNISHDLRTPLTAISSYLDLLEAHPDRLAQYLPVLRERTGALTQLTEELFRYSVITSPEFDRSPEPLTLNAVLEESILGCHAALLEQGITPELHITETPVERQLNRAALLRIFTNLLQNAMKYSGGDLQITLTDAGEIIFSNTAPHLDKVHAERLFDRFYTVENARRSTGLGLSIAKALVEQMQGSITADVTAGRLTIRIVLPAAG